MCVRERERKGERETERAREKIGEDDIAYLSVL